MRKSNISFFLFFFISLVAFSQKTTIVKIEKVIDGDSFVTTIDGDEEIIELIEIDAPEIDQKYGVAAKKHLNKYLYAEVEIEYKKRDMENHMMAWVYFTEKDGEKININHEMVVEGYAWKGKYSDDKELEKLEKKAQKDKKGLWRNANPLAPWDYSKK